MANNRTEAIAAVVAALVPTLTLAQLITLWNTELNDTYLFRKDIIASETPGGGAVTIDYSNKDTATITTGVNLAVSFSNIENGDVKYLVIAKAASNTISFVGATNFTNYQNYINTQLTSAAYVVYNKNGIIYVSALVETIITGVKADITASDLYKFPTCKAVKDAISDLDASDITSGILPTTRMPMNSVAGGSGTEIASCTSIVSWGNGQYAPFVTPPYNAGFSAGTFPLQYRAIFDGTGGRALQIRGDMLATAASGVAFTIAAPNQLSTKRGILVSSSASDSVSVGVKLLSNGDVTSTAWRTSGDNMFNAIIPFS